jgi:hypothetical protein
MGQADDKPRKRRRTLRKVPKYETPNTLELEGLTPGSSFGSEGSRFGHSSDGEVHGKPGPGGRALLWLLGRRPRDPGDERHGERNRRGKPPA